MSGPVLKVVGSQAATQLVRKHIDIRLGWALLRDRRVPIKTKAFALGAGVLLMIVLQVLEIPLEALTGIFALPFGLEDWMEGVVWPVVFACAILSRSSQNSLNIPNISEMER